MVLTGPVKPEATEAVTSTGEVTALLLSGVEMVTPPVPVREAVRSLGEGCLCWKKAIAPAARIKRTPRTRYWMKPRWKRETRGEFMRRIRGDGPLSSFKKGGFYLGVFDSANNDHVGIRRLVRVN